LLFDLFNERRTVHLPQVSVIIICLKVFCRGFSLNSEVKG
jgi:hypothetical protein